MFNRRINYKWPFAIAMFVYQRVLELCLSSKESVGRTKLQNGLTASNVKDWARKPRELCTVFWTEMITDSQPFLALARLMSGVKNIRHCKASCCLPHTTSACIHVVFIQSILVSYSIPPEFPLQHPNRWGLHKGILY